MRVFELHRAKELNFKGSSLELELELPWPTDLHDDHKVRVSGLNGELDPEKLKFYLSAISDNLVTEMFFNQNQSKAVAIFKNAIGRSRVVPIFMNSIGWLTLALLNILNCK